mmetsp:Transcript_1951/g.2871  ORF Transcript_1951/g.2871 Transcript_1951/m.2871 type:complete len:132 (+) Transcript_1951:60-455(+)
MIDFYLTQHKVPLLSKFKLRSKMRIVHKIFDELDDTVKLGKPLPKLKIYIYLIPNRELKVCDVLSRKRLLHSFVRELPLVYDFRTGLARKLVDWLSSSTCVVFEEVREEEENLKGLGTVSFFLGIFFGKDE